MYNNCLMSFMNSSSACTSSIFFFLTHLSLRYTVKSFLVYESEMRASKRRALQEQLVRVIMRVLSRNEDLHYYQV